MSIVSDIANLLNIEETEASMILAKAMAGGEINELMSEKEWFENRFQPNIVFIDEDGYTKMCVDALKILGSTAATDYGSSRQRDLGQLWADMTRGYLGEFAFQMFLKKNLGFDSKLGHEIGNLDEFLPQDIHFIKEPEGEYRTPKLTISIKTSKWNGIWLDIPGDQFNHSDIHVFVKVGTGRDHLFAFFKKISVFRDKVLMKGQSVGALTAKESEDIYNGLPNFSMIPAYICGYVKKNKDYCDLPYGGKKGRKNYTIKEWCGAIKSGDLEKIKKKENINGSVKFEGIGEFAHDSGYLFNTGNLLWKKSDWDEIKLKI
jgi:hypothetical protein